MVVRAVGDVLLGRGVGRGWHEHDLSTLFAEARVLLRSADVTFGNLESVAAHRGQPGAKKILFRAHPATLLALKDAGFDAVSLANNHANDYGPRALTDTITHLQNLGVSPVGVRLNDATKPTLCVLNRKGLRLGLLAYNQFRAGHASLRNPGAMDAMLADIATARSQVDRLMVSMHWGVEYQSRPTIWQQRVGRAAIDAGADLVVGHHPHVYQGLERYRGGVIAYSLGNFLFDQPAKANRRGLLLEWRIQQPGTDTFQVWPTAIAARPYRARLLYGTRAERVLTEVATLSQALGTYGVVRGGTFKLAHAAPELSAARDATNTVPR